MLVLLTCWGGQDFLQKQNILLMDYLRIRKHCLVLVAFMVISEMGIYAADQFFQQHLKAQHPIFYCPLSIFFRREMERENKDY